MKSHDLQSHIEDDNNLWAFSRISGTSYLIIKIKIINR